MKMKFTILAACASILVLTASFAHAGTINWGDGSSSQSGEISKAAKTTHALPHNRKQKVAPSTTDSSIFDRWGNMRSKK